MSAAPPIAEPARICANDDPRRASLLDHPTLNGIDYLEVDPADHRILRVHFVKPLPPADHTNPNDPNDAYGIVAHLGALQVEGGTRVVGIRVVSAARKAGGSLELHVDPAGDYSPYRLTIDSGHLDPFFRTIDFSFMAACPVEIDCPGPPDCAPPTLPEPLLDYLAKDYSSFRRLLLDLLPQLNPRYVERNPSDLGIALIELLAYTGDRLSYYQDAVANEAYLGTVRRRISARRHARLVDYRMHDGRNAWTVVQFTVLQPCTLPGPPDTSAVVTRIVAPLGSDPAPPGLLIDPAALAPAALAGDPALAGVAVFETAHAAALAPENNEIFIHDWGNEECCLPPGTTEAYLYSVPSGTTAVRPALRPGDRLLLEEVLGPQTGAAPDASPAHRQVVVIEAVDTAALDPLYSATLAAGGELQRVAQATPPGTPLPLLGVRWRRVDALSFPLCLAANPPDVGRIRNVSIARGNLVLADNGLTISERIELDRSVPADARFQLPLSNGPLTLECRPALVDYDPQTGRPTTPRLVLDGPVEEAQPAVALLVDFPDGRELWRPVPDLLESPSGAQDFVAEVDDDGRPLLRFGDGEYGREIEGAGGFTAVYRIGNGAAGNVGAEAVAHLALPPAAAGCVGRITAVRNPLAGSGGVDAETIERVRVRAPQAFRAQQLRAVTEADYAAAAADLPEVSGAVATFRWTGSWYTVFVGVDPADPADLVNLPDGETVLAPDLAQTVRVFLESRRLAGYDLEIRPPEFVPLDLELEICAGPEFFRADVAKAVRDALSNHELGGGRRGFFDPANFTFGRPVYLSRIYAAVEAVEGVRSATVRVFQRYGHVANGELASGVLPIGPWQIARLDNDPNFVEHGVLAIEVAGGKG